MRVRTSPGRLAHLSGTIAASVTCGMLTLVAQAANGQTPPVSRPRLQGGADFVQGFAVGDFRQRVNLAAGGLFQLDVGLGDSIFSVGGEVGMMGYGHESRKVDVSSLIPDIPGATLTVNTDNTMVLLHARLRAQRKTGRWRPYADALVGGNWISTDTSLDCTATGINGTSGSCDAPSATNAEDFLFSVGAGGGVMIAFTPRPAVPRLDLSFRYLRGGKGTYLTKGAIHREGSIATVDLSRSRTDMVAFYVGAVVGR
jgi:hypothetical protein